jgi:hypothetical protein
MDLEFINSLMVVAGRILVGYISFAIVVFVIAYYVLFDPRATSAGKVVFRFMLSLVGVILLSFVGTFIDPSTSGYTRSIPPPDVFSWRSLLRLVVYGYVAYAITSLAAILAFYRWWPERIKSKGFDFAEPRNTKEHPIIIVPRDE